MDRETRGGGPEHADRHVPRPLRRAQQLSQPTESNGLVLALMVMARVMT
jgi:hypothetical protein